MLKSKSFLFLAIAGLTLTGASVHADSNLTLKHATQLVQPSEKLSNQDYQSGGLVQSVIPDDSQSTTLQSPSQAEESTLGASGLTQDKQDVVAASSLPTLWNPLNPKSGNYNATTPVLWQQDLENCWDYAGVDAIGVGAQVQKIEAKAPAMLPAYYDYLSAGNAFTNASNPFAIAGDNANSARQLGEGNTLDYVSAMSVMGYDPRLPGNGLNQLMKITQDIPIAHAKFTGLKTAGLHANSTYQLSGLTVAQLPKTTAAIQARANQIKQLVYQYGSVQFGMEAEYGLDQTLKTGTGKGISSKSTTAGDYSSYTPYSAATNDVAGKADSYSKSGYDYPALTFYDSDNKANWVMSDHEIQIVGYDDNYAASNFKQNPSMNGAFIVKNSWGSSWGTKGYFYLSYADVFLAGSTMIADGVVKTPNQTIYSATNESPDASGWYYDIKPTNNNIFANTFTSKAASSTQIEQLKAIAANVNQAGAKVNVLYKAGGVTGATKLSDFRNLGSYAFTDSGYQTIPFAAVNLPNHGTFTVALQVTNMTKFSNFQLSVQNLGTASDGVYPTLTSKNSWISLNGAWTALSENEGSNIYLDAHSAMAGAASLSFNTNGGSAIASEKVLTGKAAAKPANPTRAGYLFEGWYANAGLTQPYNFATALTANKSVYAKWKVDPNQAIYRLYNKNSGEHFYTSSLAEKNALAKVGWSYEGVGWYAPKTSASPIYRVYNPNAKGGDHYYTKSKSEATHLVKVGWKWDNSGKPVFYSGGSTAIYVAYNPNAQSGAHNYTKNSAEQKMLLSIGWKYGAVAWYANK